MDTWIKFLGALAIAVGAVTTLLTRIGSGFAYIENKLKAHVSLHTTAAKDEIIREVAKSVNRMDVLFRSTEKLLRDNQAKVDLKCDELLKKLEAIESELDSLRRVGTPWKDEKTIVKGNKP